MRERLQNKLNQTALIGGRLLKMAVPTSKAHRRRMEPAVNSRRLSDSLANFFKVMLPSTINDQKLDIPLKSAIEFGDELSDVATLSVPTGDEWQVRLQRGHNKIWFVDGWHQFVEHHSLTHGQFLVFSYQGSSTFHVRIFDFSSCEIDYPCVAQSIKDVEDDVCGTLPSRHASVKGKGKCVDQHVKRKRKSVANAKKLKRAKLNENRNKEIFVFNTSAYTYPNRKLKIPEESQKVIHAATMFKLENPFFAVILQSPNLDKYYMYVPSAFARKYMIGCSEIIKFEDSDGKQWDIRCVSETNTNFRIGKGCCEFFRDISSKEGDVCLFELIKRKDVVLKVSVLRAAEYAAMVHQKNKYTSVENANEEDEEDVKPDIVGLFGNGAPRSHEVSVKENAQVVDSGTLYCSQKIEKMSLSRETKRAIKAARALKIQNPAFMVTLQPHNMYNSIVHVPAEFVKNHLLGCTEFINLKASGLKKWRVRCTYREPRSQTKKITTGWNAFSKDNDLKAGDVCVLELIKSKGIVLKASIFRESDYAK